MSYLTQSRITEDTYLLNRVTACAAVESIPEPASWARERRWELSGMAGWVDAYRDASAPPGADEDAITDSMILAAVQALNT